MSYFDEVYLKRMNKDGTTIQERVKTRKENEFNNLFLRKTKYQAYIYQYNDEQKEVCCSIQPNKWNQDTIVSNLLVSTACDKFKTGDILHTYQKVKNEEYDKVWIIVYVSEDITHGYQLYEVIELNETISHCDEYGDTLHIIPVKFVSQTSVFVKDKFISSEGIMYREPNASRRLITQNYDFLKKELYFTYKNRAWEIVGIDNISIDGVAYVSIAERLVKEPEPKSSQNILVGEDKNFFLNHQKG